MRVTFMPKAKSGRIVVDIDPALKRHLYSVLAMDNFTLKEWFIRSAERYVEQKSEPSLAAKKIGSAK